MAETPTTLEHVDPLLPAAGLAQYGFTIFPARKMFDHRLFPLVKIGGRLYVRRSVFEAFLNASTIPARDPK